MPDQPEPTTFRYIDADEFCLSARLMPDFDTGGVTDTLSISIEGDEPQSVHVPVADLPKILAGLAGAAGKPVVDCPACEAGIEHTAHCPTPETHNAGCGCPSDTAASGDQPDTRPASCACDGQTLLQVHTPTGCHDEAPARPVPDAERRERWDAVWPDPFGTLTADQAEAVQAMKAKLRAVADEEQQRERERLFIPLHRAESDNARLRAELEQARATTLTEAADAIQDMERRNAWDVRPMTSSLYAEFLRGMAAAGSGGQAEDGAQPDLCAACGHLLCAEQSPCGAFLRAYADTENRCPCTGTADVDGAQQK
ncbi:hypothetical protein GCM10011583_18370 [Streptomyces camponoticapitis]|uniref:Uncharacterized protein n=1 Tax=Streptomyces camponoticapitis TaxID=1616125 RepID=A0ABQ2E1J7_9ACTN|nr:hypothetical protein [Streptomyces camponoticapitis]GGJ87144.1 hypothetical protein GCM10011583_18370 [Streptomyces camponoticapitis]